METIPRFEEALAKIQETHWAAPQYFIMAGAGLTCVEIGSLRSLRSRFSLDPWNEDKADIKIKDTFPSECQGHSRVPWSLPTGGRPWRRRRSCSA